MPQPTQEYERAIAGNLDTWVPACGGTETPFHTRGGRVLLYCFNPQQHRHAYLDQQDDVILTDEEAQAFLCN